MDRVLKTGSIDQADWTEEQQAGNARQPPAFVVMAPAPSPRGGAGVRGSPSGSSTPTASWLQP